MEALKESLKEGLRVVLLAVIPLAIDMLTSGHVSLNALGIAAAIAGLRFIDKWLHTSGKAEKGLTRF